MATSRLPLAFLALSGLAACRGSAGSPAAADTARAYARAVGRADGAEVHALLDSSTRAAVEPASVSAALRENGDELREQAHLVSSGLSRGALRVRARLTTHAGKTVELALEDGAWRISGGILDAPVLETPLDAVAAFRDALERRSLRAVARVLARQTRAELETELQDLASETREGDALAVEISGNEATVRTPGGRVLTLVREGLEWRIVEVE